MQSDQEQEQVREQELARVRAQFISTFDAEICSILARIEAIDARLRETHVPQERSCLKNYKQVVINAMYDFVLEYSPGMTRDEVVEAWCYLVEGPDLVSCLEATTLEQL